MTDFKKFKVNIGTAMAQTNIPWASGTGGFSGLAAMQTGAAPVKKTAFDNMIEASIRNIENAVEDPKRYVDISKFTDESIAECVRDSVESGALHPSGAVPENPEFWLNYVFRESLSQASVFDQPFAFVPDAFPTMGHFDEFMDKHIFPSMPGIKVKLESIHEDAMYGDAFMCYNMFGKFAQARLKMLIPTGFTKVQLRPVLFTTKDNRTIIVCPFMFDVIRKDGTPAIAINFVWSDAAFVSKADNITLN